MRENELVRQLEDLHKDRSGEVERLQRIDVQMKRVRELILLADHRYIEVTPKRYGSFKRRRRRLCAQRAEVVTRLSHMKKVRKELEWELYCLRKFGNAEAVAA